jgi:hypothetical protein
MEPDNPGGFAYSKCSMYAVNFTDMLRNGIEKADPSWPVQSCQNGWEYNFTEIPYSTVATDVSIRQTATYLNVSIGL